MILGAQDISVNEPSQKKFNVDKVVVHPKYNSDTSDNDIALLHLSTSISFNQYIKAVTLPTADVLDKTPCVITGWGCTSQGIYRSWVSYLKWARSK